MNFVQDVMPSPQSAATQPTSRPQIESFFLVQRTNDLRPAIFSGPTTRPSTAP